MPYGRKVNMVKMIVVTGCNNCPFGALWSLDTCEYMCSKLSKVNKKPLSPLENCPLENGADVIKKVLKA